MIRSLVLALVFTTTLSASAQQTTVQAPNEWARVEAVPTATNIHVNTAQSHEACALKAVDAESLTCVSHDGGRTMVYKRSEIASIQAAHRTRSAWVAEGIAYGGAVLTSVVANREGGTTYGKAAVIVLVALVAVISAPFIGYFTDFTRSTIYRAK